MATQFRTCYRHPDQPAGVVCQRCDRPICPRCMNQASVGFQCPECVRATHQRVYTARTLQQAQQPVVTLTLIAVNVIVYVYGLVLGGANGGTTPDRVIADGGLIGEAFRQGNRLLIPLAHQPVPPGMQLIGVAHGDWWRIFSSGFLHAGVAHIALNMFALYILGMLTERLIGWWRFGLLYLVSLVAGSLGALIVTPRGVGVGASGAIFGLFGVLIVAAWVRGIDIRRSGLLTWLVLDLVFTFVVPGISIGAHIGGLIGGTIAGVLLLEVPRRLPNLSTTARQTVAVLLTAAFGVACVAGALAVASSTAKI